MRRAQPPARATRVRGVTLALLAAGPASVMASPAEVDGAGACDSSTVSTQLCSQKHAICPVNFL